MAHLPRDSREARVIWNFGEDFVCRRSDPDGLYTREPCGCRLGWYREERDTVQKTVVAAVDLEAEIG